MCAYAPTYRDRRLAEPAPSLLLGHLPIAKRSLLISDCEALLFFLRMLLHLPILLLAVTCGDNRAFLLVGVGFVINFTIVFLPVTGK